MNSAGISRDQMARVVASAGGVVVALVDGRAYIALVQRRDGTWVIPKGHRNAGEKARDAAFREVQEEIGVARTCLATVRYLGGYVSSEQHADGDERKTSYLFLFRYERSSLPALKTDQTHLSAAWHVLPLKGIQLCYPYQQKLLEKLSREHRWT